MAGKYNHREVEAKWQKQWEESQAFKTTEDKNKKKTYLLIEFPYPSGDGLHVGHIRSWTALDIVARKRRMQGENVLYPIGWDAFGLPAENYALKTGIHPKISTQQNTDNFRRQIKSLGISFDWSREVNTTDPKYYKWTQWIFLQLHKNGLAYKARTIINWCPTDKIGLANEEVVDGACERCGTPVEKREKEQWMLAITKYAKRLYDDLETVDYIEAAKAGQRNWIGPSEGAEISFLLNFTHDPKANDNRGPNGERAQLKVFTTRPDTLFGATYLVLSPEHLWVTLATDDKHDVLLNKAEVKTNVQQAKKKTEIERTAEGKEKTGVELKGVKAINPATKEEVPMYVADYVIAGYGTGAIMAVPAHDERDFAFAKKFGLPIRRVIEPTYVGREEGAPKPGEDFIKRNAVCIVLRNPKDDSYLCNIWKTDRMHGLPTGGVEDGEDMIEAALREIREETGYKNVKLVSGPNWAINSFFYHRQKKQNRWARFHYFFFDLENEERDPVDPQEIAKHEFVWKKKEELKDFFSVFEGRFLVTILNNPEYVHTSEGYLASSSSFDGVKSEEAKKKITEFVGGEWKMTYKLRDWVFSRQRYWGEPIPMIKCEKDGWVPVPESELPVELPQVEKYQPSESGESPLANIAQWVNTKCPKCGGPARRETDVMPNWAGSSWYYLRYCDPENNKEFASQEKLKYWSPVDWYNGGMEHTTLHLLYSRFWHKFLYDQKLVPTSEPYAKRTSHGLILAEGGEKMSKSKGNVISPDDIVESHGADALRLYEMFIGSFDQNVAWSTSSIAGVSRFLERVWKLEPSQEIEEMSQIGLLDKTVKKITEDIESLKMNTAVSALMIFLNELEVLPEVPRKGYEALIKLLAPLAPHIAHELAEKHTIDISAWPTYDKKNLASASVQVAIQINGKTRGSVELAPSAAEGEALASARANPSVAKWLEGGREVKAIYVPGKIISFVVEKI